MTNPYYLIGQIQGHIKMWRIWKNDKKTLEAISGLLDKFTTEQDSSYTKTMGVINEKSDKDSK